MFQTKNYNLCFSNQSKLEQRQIISFFLIFLLQDKNQKGQVQQQPVAEVRTTTPLGSKPAPIFVPTSKQVHSKLEPTKSMPNPAGTGTYIENTNLNVKSVEFKRVTTAQQDTAALAGTASQLGVTQSTDLNTNLPNFTTQGSFQNTLPASQQLAPSQISMLGSNAFRPQNVRSPPPPQTFQVNQQIVQMQQQLDQRIQRAITENVKVRLEDLIEDPNIALPKEEIQEQIKFICNNTGKTNFAQKLEELKTSVSQDPQVNLKWFIHYILTRRISQAANILNPRKQLQQMHII